MKSRGMGACIMFLFLAVAFLSGGCGGAPPCGTSLVTLDETRLDAETYEQEAAETGRNAAELEKKLNDKKKDIAEVKDKPAELRKKVNDRLKGSGRE